MGTELILIGGLFGIVGLVIIRELILWYFKIATIIKNQNEMIRLLEKIAGENHKPKEDLIDKAEKIFSKTV